MSLIDINAYDAFALLEKRLLYKNQLKDLLVDGLKAKKILCISDTSDVLIDTHHQTPSVAHTIERAQLGSQIEVIQSDFREFDTTLSDEELAAPDSPRFGAHLPQDEAQTRREYLKIDATQLKNDLQRAGKIDVILGRNCLCNCAGENRLCGGIEKSVEAQQKYLQTLTEKSPDLIVLTASSAMFFPEDDSQETAERKVREQLGYKEAHQNMILACEKLNALEQSPYRFVVVEPDRNLKFTVTNPKNENGYIIVGYDTRKISFQPTTVCLQSKREQEKVMAERDNTSVRALLEQRKKLQLQNVLTEDKENTLPNSGIPQKHT